MQANEILQLARNAPFQPFTIHMSDGSAYAIRHPEQVMVSQRSVHVGINGGSDTPDAFDDIAICSLVHVTRLTPGVAGAGSKRGKK